ncbi:MAG: MYXO-CTERM sorting domain-containing protein, partial [Myxococcales bacterium]
SSEKCVQNACVNVSCGAGTHCVNGSCVDDCTGAVCPSGEKCEAGRCVPAPQPLDGGFGGDAGSVGTDDAGLDDDPFGNVDTPRDAGTRPAQDPDGAAEAAGCGCSSPAGGALASAALVLLGLARRRRAR